VGVVRRGDSLAGGDTTIKPPTPKPRKRNKRVRPKKAFGAEYTLAILRESAEPLSARQINERLAEYYRPLGRQGMNWVLLKLEREEKVKRVEAGGGPARTLWGAAD